MATSTYSGRVLKSDLEGRVWTLVTDQGVVYQLKDADAGLRVDGQRVELTGRIAEGQMGLAMVGDILEVVSYRVLD